MKMMAAFIDTDFNPRSLTGATKSKNSHAAAFYISIHAPLRERRARERKILRHDEYFNPRSLTGATKYAASNRRS